MGFSILKVWAHSMLWTLTNQVKQDITGKGMWMTSVFGTPYLPKIICTIFFIYFDCTKYFSNDLVLDLIFSCLQSQQLRMLMDSSYFKVIYYCYIASAKTKRDWLIRGHVTLDKCNVSLGL